MKLEESTVQAMDEAGAIKELAIEEVRSGEKTVWRLLVGFEDEKAAPVKTFRSDERHWAKSDTLIQWLKKHCSNTIQHLEIKVRPLISK